jgi:hypothetical protein
MAHAPDENGRRDSTDKGDRGGDLKGETESLDESVRAAGTCCKSLGLP